MKYILAWLIATTLMTAFSYLFCYLTKKEAREPFLLTYIVISTFPIFKQYKFSDLIGWILHYILGVGFLLLNILLIFIFDVEYSIFWGLPFGIIAGLLGILGWKFLFSVADQLPKIDIPIYYSQLLVAHIVFCISAIAVYIHFE